MLNWLLSLNPTPIVAITDESGRALRVSTGQAGTRPEWFLAHPLQRQPLNRVSGYYSNTWDAGWIVIDFHDKPFEENY